MSYQVPKISVLIAAYNAQAFFHESLDSICNQDFDDFECIIVNDGSTDSTLKIIDRYVTRDQRFRVINQKNQGQLAALNFGLEFAKGKYIARMDADDVSMPHRLRIQAEVLDKLSEVVLVTGGIELIRMDGSFMTIDHPPLNDADIRKSLYCGNPIYHPSVMFRKDEMLKVGGYIGGDTAEHCEDFNLWLRLADVGQFAAVPKVVLRYRINPDSITANYRHLQDRRINAMVDRLWDGSIPMITDRKRLRDTLQHYGNIELLGYSINLQSRVLNDHLKLSKQFWKRGHTVLAINQLLAILSSGVNGFRFLLRIQRGMVRRLFILRRARRKNPWEKAKEKRHL